MRRPRPASSPSELRAERAAQIAWQPPTRRDSKWTRLLSPRYLPEEPLRPLGRALPEERASETVLA
eukprot:scaffold198399_cov30-Tisochrysis_lutea.AAC.3